MKNRGGEKRGQSLVEFALVAPIFFLLVMGIFDFGRLFFTQMTLQNALRQAGRFAVTGNHLTDSQGQTLSRIDSILQTAQKSAVGLPVSNVQISSLQGGTGSAGGPGDTVTISLIYDMKLITPIVGQFFNNGSYHLVVSTSFKNEPFPPSQTN